MTPSATWKAKRHRDEYELMRERLIDAAWELACTKGIEALTLNAVAAQANCARSSVYRYFDNKDQLLGAVLQNHVYYLKQEMDKELQRWTEAPEQMVRGLYLAVTTARSGPSLELFRTLLVDDGRMLADCLIEYVPQIAPEILSDPVFTRARTERRIHAGVSDEDILRWMITVGMGLVQQSSLENDKETELTYLRKMLIPSIFKSRPARS